MNQHSLPKPDFAIKSSALGFVRGPVFVVPQIVIPADPEAAATGYHLSFNQLLNIVMQESRVSKRDILGPWRYAEAAHARQAFMWLARIYTSKSFPQIGMFLGKDHTTVYHGYKVVCRVLSGNGLQADEFTHPRAAARLILNADWSRRA